MNSLFKNKKAQVPIVSDIVNAIGSSIQWLTQSAPKPFAILFFLLLLVLAVSLMSLGFRLFGYHCNSIAQPMKVDTFNLITNVKLIFNLPDVSTLKSSTRPVGDLFGIGLLGSACGIKNTGQTINGITNNNWVYLGKQCTTCSLADYNSQDTGTISACNSNAYNIPTENKTFYQKVFCGSIYCEPPTNYYWRQTDNLYVCTGSSTCASWTVAKEWDSKLAEAGAILLYPQGQNLALTSDDVFSVTCDNNLRAGISVYSLPILDYRIWLFTIIFMSLLAFMIWVVATRK